MRRSPIRTVFPLLALTVVFVCPVTSLAQDQMQRLDRQFDGLFGWFEGMIDPETGGVFYSSATRDRPQDYPPHLESTAKYVHALEWAQRMDTLSPGVRDGLVRYFKSRQVSPNAPGGRARYAGFFMDEAYPGLDPREDDGPRRDYAAARATSMALRSLEYLGAEPEHTPPDPSSNAEALPHLRSGEAFTRWLDGLKWERAWTAGGDILTQADHIERIEDEALREELLRAVWGYLPTKQDAATGYWGARHDDGSWAGVNDEDYMLLNGAHKIVAFYEAFDEPVPHAGALVDSVLAEVRDGKVVHICYPYNSAQLMRNLLRQNGVSLSPQERDAFVEREIENLAMFLQPDGGFSTLLGRHGGNRFEPAVDGPTSNTDASGLALKGRNALYDIVAGEAPPLGEAE